MKLFSMIPNGISANQDPVNNFTMKLSKNYGMIQLVPFAMFLEHPANMSFFSMQIIGLNSGIVQAGYSQPVFSDYFKLSAGDILFWNYYRYPSNIQQPTVKENYRDSITTSFISSDSIVYTYHRVIEHEDLSLSFQFGNLKYFLRDDLQQLVESAPDWFSFGNDHYLDSYRPANRQMFLGSAVKCLLLWILLSAIQLLQ